MKKNNNDFFRAKEDLNSFKPKNNNSNCIINQNKIDKNKLSKANINSNDKLNYLSNNLKLNSRKNYKLKNKKIYKRISKIHLSKIIII